MSDPVNPELERRLEDIERELAATKTLLESLIAQNDVLFNQLRDSDLQVQTLQDEVGALTLSRDTTAAQLAAAEQALRHLVIRLRRLEAVRVAPPAPAQPAPSSRSTPAAAAPATPGLSLTTIAAAAIVNRAQAAAAKAVAARSSLARSARDNAFTIIMVEAQPPLEKALRGAAEKWGGNCCLPADVLAAPPAGRRLLAVNLAHASTDPLAIIAASPQLGIDPPVAFTYCADGEHGVVLGLFDCFPPPFDVPQCCERILRRPDQPQRVLIVSGNVEVTNALREPLTAGKRAASMAFDARQALDLVAMIRPQLVLIDLGMPNGGGLRLACRFRSNSQTTNLALAFFWTAPIDPTEFRQHAQRAILDLPFSPGTLARAISAHLGPGAAPQHVF